MKKNIFYIAFICFLVSLSSFSQTIISIKKQPASNSGFVFISPDFSSDKIDTIAGTKLTFTLVAKDSLGNIIQDWNSSGSTITVLLKNSTANTDSSNRSWNSDADGYSYAILSISNSSLPQPQKISDDTWEISPTSFVKGQAQLCLIDSKSEKDIHLQIFPQKDLITQSSAKMKFKPDTISNILTEITSQTNKPNQVYQMRKYEVVVTPRDRYLNYSNETIIARFTARFPGEFDFRNTSLPDPFKGDQIINGATNFIFLSTLKRPSLLMEQLQFIMPFGVVDNNIRGKSDFYEILSHEPGPFTIQSPSNNSEIKIEPNVKAAFTWDDTNPSDVFKNVKVSRFNSTIISDTVLYTLHLVDLKTSNSQTFLTGNKGIEPSFTLNENQLLDVMKNLSGSSSTKIMNLIWFIEATDGFYKVYSDPRDGFNIRFNKTFPYDVNDLKYPMQTILNQNFPNPFGAKIGNGSSSTRISFSLYRSSQIILKVYNALGKEISTLTNQFYEAGEHTVTFDAANLPAGNYFYRLFANGKVLTKQMTVVK